MLFELVVVGALAGVIMKRAKKKRLRRFLKPNALITPGLSLHTQSPSIADNTFTGKESPRSNRNLASESHPQAAP